MPEGGTSDEAGVASNSPERVHGGSESQDIAGAATSVEDIFEVMPDEVLLAIMRDYLTARDRFVLGMAAREGWRLLHSPELWEHVVSECENALIPMTSAHVQTL